MNPQQNNRESDAHDPETLNRIFVQAFYDRGELLCGLDDTGTAPILQVGDHAHEILGLAPTDLQGVDLCSLFEEADALRTEFRRVLSHSGAALDITARSRSSSADKRLVWLRCRATEDGTLGRVLAVSVERGAVPGTGEHDEETFHAVGTILGASDVALTIVDEEYRVVTFNGTAGRNARAALGVPLETGTCLLDIAAPGTLERLTDNLRRAFHGEFVSSEWDTVLDGGRHVAYLFNYVPIRDAEGGISRVVVSTYDMSADRTMRDQNRDLAVAIEQSPVSVVVTDTDGTIQYVNTRMERATGYSRDELIGRNPRILQSGLTDPSVFTEMWDSISRGEVWQGEMVNRRKDGSLLVESAVIAPVVDDTGAVVRYIGLKEDVTEERKMQRALHDSEERYRTLFETAPVGILICNADGVVEQTNEALGAIFGIPELGRATHFRASSFAPLAESGLHDTLRDVMEQDRTVYRETDYNLTDEHTITLRYVVTPTHDGAGAVDGAQALVEDFTWIYAANRQIRRSLNEKESLLREIHHRVKNNLQTLASLLRLQSDESHDPAVAEALRDSVARVQTMGMVHERLYASESLARIAFHDYLHDLVGHLISLGFGEGERPEVELEVEALELDINLAIPVGLIANEFVTNALKHGVSRASEPRLSVTARQCDQGLVLRVLDNGPGFSGEAPPVQSGSLGMNLITALANQLHATVTYDSRNGHLAQLVVPLHDGGAPTQPC